MVPGMGAFTDSPPETVIAGAAGAAKETVEEILDCVACDDVLRILRDAGLCESTMTRIIDRVRVHLQHRSDEMEIGALTFSKEYGILGKTGNVDELLTKITEE